MGKNIGKVKGFAERQNECTLSPSISRNVVLFVYMYIFIEASTKIMVISNIERWGRRRELVRVDKCIIELVIE